MPLTRRAPRCARWTRIPNTSSNVGRSSRALTTSLWVRMASTTSGVAVPASSTMTVRVRGPSWRTRRTNGSERRASPSNGVAVSIATTSPPIASRRRSSGVARATSRPAAMRATWSHASASSMCWVVTMSVRPPVAQPVQLLPDTGSQERVDPRGRLVEEQERRVVDERAGQLEPPLHPAGQAAGASATDLPQVEQLEDLAGPPTTRSEQHPEQRADEVDVLADGQIREQGERLGHVADPLARLPSERAGFLAEDRDGPGGRHQGTGQQADGRRLAGARRTDHTKDGAGRDDERDVVDGELVGEPHAHPVDSDGGWPSDRVGRRRVDRRDARFRRDGHGDRWRGCLGLHGEPIVPCDRLRRDRRGIAPHPSGIAASRRE